MLLGGEDDGIGEDGVAFEDVEELDAWPGWLLASGVSLGIESGSGPDGVGELTSDTGIGVGIGVGASCKLSDMGPPVLGG